MVVEAVGMVIHIVAQEEESSVLRCVDETVPKKLVFCGVSFYGYQNDLQFTDLQFCFAKSVIKELLVVADVVFLVV